jgi:hypothetical protein
VFDEILQLSLLKNEFLKLHKYLKYLSQIGKITHCSHHIDESSLSHSKAAENNSQEIEKTKFFECNLT